MKLRKIAAPRKSKQEAETILKKDFELFKSMYIDKTLHWLYKSNSSENDNDEQELNYECHPYPEEIEFIQAQYNNYSYNEFKKDIRADSIFFIENNNQIYGYVLVRNNSEYLHIAEWAITANLTEIDLKEVLGKLLKLYPKKEWMVLPCNEKAKNFFAKNGFEDENNISVKKAALSN